MRVVLDTNVLVSALLWPGNPTKLIEFAADGVVQLFASKLLIEEFSDVLQRPKLAVRVAATGMSATELVQQYQRLAHRVTASKLITRISRDIDDDAVLACAITAKADAIVSGDQDLLTLRSIDGIPILTVAQAIARVERMPGLSKTLRP